MACYHPIAAYQKAPGARLIFARSAPHNIQVPCNKCLGCKQAHANAWGLRSLHESARSPYNTFLNLTYNDEHLPISSHLQWHDVQLFLKRLRQKQAREARRIMDGTSPLRSDTSQNIRFLACGEYGPRTQRPHYHLILYNCSFADQFQVAKDLYDSAALQRLWSDKDGKPLGATRIAPATYQRAVYIAKYTFKDQRTHRRLKGEVDTDGVWRPAPFARMSLRPAIAKDWIQKYWQDLEHGYLIHQGEKTAIPRYYKKWVNDNRPYFRALMAESIQRNAQQEREDRQPERLADAERIHQQRKQKTGKRDRFL